MSYKITPAIERLLPRINKRADGCWGWVGATTGNGYGVIGVGGRSGGNALVHRVTYEHFVGPIPEKLHIDHLCRNKLCVNPDHLEAVTQSENNFRVRGHRTPKAACNYGHPLAGDGVKWNEKQRKHICVACTATNRPAKRLGLTRREYMNQKES